MKNKGKPKIGRPPGVTKRKVSLTIDNDVLKKVDKKRGKKSLSWFAEHAMKALLNAEQPSVKQTQLKALPPVLDEANSSLSGRA